MSQNTAEVAERTATPEEIRLDEIAAHVENNLRDAYAFGDKVNGVDTDLSAYRDKAARARGDRAGELVDVIDSGDEHAEAAMAELAAIEGEASGYRLATAKLAIEQNATGAGIDYIGASYADMEGDSTKLTVDSMADHMAQVAAGATDSDRRKAAWDYPGFASADRGVTQDEFKAAVAESYKLAGVERNPEPFAKDVPYTDGLTQTVYNTPTELGFTISESIASDGKVTSSLIVDTKTN